MPCIVGNLMRSRGYAATGFGIFVIIVTLCRATSASRRGFGIWYSVLRSCQGQRARTEKPIVGIISFRSEPHSLHLCRFLGRRHGGAKPIAMMRDRERRMMGFAKRLTRPAFLPASP